MTITSAKFESAQPETRVERKRRVARASIINAAEKLMRAQPIDEVTVGDITEAADVGHGTFYLHFKSKNEVLIPITRAIAREWDGVLQESFKVQQDPAEVVSHSTRHMARAVLQDPLWQWLLKHSGVPVDDIRNAIGRFASRDFERGYNSGRFQVPNVRVANRYLVGGFVTCVLASFAADDPGETIDDMTELLLRTLGVATDEAAIIAHQPLMKLSTATGALL